MIRALVLIFALVASACATIAGGYTQGDIAKLAFLEGRWQGAGPDGAPFYEQYDFPTPATLRSQRFDAAFTTVSDTSTVSLEDGGVFSRWGDYSWKATEIADGYIAFAPVNAPSAFHWKKLDASTVEVVQKFTGEDGKPQTYTVLLKRIA
ncbi:MAG: hypothetical protein Q8R82_10155 [Hyphomonadaceae bacterium]|nr:hypothetical protein [Hyphomonadaceae bacterium]